MKLCYMLKICSGLQLLLYISLKKPLCFLLHNISIDNTFISVVFSMFSFSPFFDMFWFSFLTKYPNKKNTTTKQKTKMMTIFFISSNLSQIANAPLMMEPLTSLSSDYPLITASTTTTIAIIITFISDTTSKNKIKKILSLLIGAVCSYFMPFGARL